MTRQNITLGPAYQWMHGKDSGDVDDPAAVDSLDLAESGVASSLVKASPSRSCFGPPTSKLSTRGHSAEA
jgi:hypothetical protein